MKQRKVQYARILDSTSPNANGIVKGVAIWVDPSTSGLYVEYTLQRKSVDPVARTCPLEG